MITRFHRVAAVAAALLIAGCGEERAPVPAPDPSGPPGAMMVFAGDWSGVGAPARHVTLALFPDTTATLTTSASRGRDLLVERGRWDIREGEVRFALASPTPDSFVWVARGESLIPERWDRARWGDGGAPLRWRRGRWPHDPITDD